MRRHPVVRCVTVLGLATSGLIAGHALGYAVAVPDDVHRTTLLEATGHSYWPSASRLAVILGIAAVVAGIASGYTHQASARRTSWSSVAWRLAALQCAGFVSLEVIERAMTSAPLGTLSVGVLVVGLLSQLVVALLLALLVVGLRRLGAVLRSTALSVAAPSTRRLVCRSDVVPFSRTPVRDRVRGPPAAVQL